MKLPTEIFGDVVVVHAPEEWSAEHCDALSEFFNTLEQDNVVLDIDAVESIDSKGLTTMLDFQDALRDRGGDLKISATNKYNRKILELTRLDQQLEAFDAVMDAVKSFH